MTDFDDEESSLELEEIPPLIAYEQDTPHQTIPGGFTSATVYVDLRPKSRLVFDTAKQEVLRLKNKGIDIVFDLDFGFSDSDWKGFSHQGYLSSCIFALNRFVSDVLEQHEALGCIFGCIFGRFSLKNMHLLNNAQEHDFFSWKEEKKIRENTHDEYLKALFYRDVLIEYLDALAMHVPSYVTRLLLFDAQGLTNALLFYQLTQTDRFEAFSLAIASSACMHEHLTWQQGVVTKGYIGKILPTFQEIPEPNCAVVLPEFDKIFLNNKPIFERTLQNLIEKERPFKVIPETYITSEWHGIDEFFVCHTLDNESTKRALEGFIATGGSVQQLTEM